MATGPDRQSLQDLLHDEMFPAEAGPEMNRRRYFSEPLRPQQDA